MGWIGCARCEKFLCNFVAQTFALIAPIQPILHRVSCNNEMVPNAPKHYETQQNMSLGVQWGTSSAFVAKIRRQLCSMNFCINCTSWARFAPSFLHQKDDSKCTQTQRIAPKHEFRIQCSESGAFIANNSDMNSWH